MNKNGEKKEGKVMECQESPNISMAHSQYDINQLLFPHYMVKNHWTKQSFSLYSFWSLLSSIEFNSTLAGCSDRERGREKERERA